MGVISLVLTSKSVPAPWLSSPCLPSLYTWLRGAGGGAERPGQYIYAQQKGPMQAVTVTVTHGGSGRLP